ncbi:MAG: hypothetical protein Q8R00_01875 [Candidatus Nanoarchaeia archaeon]|nr:hypothetical protein [Candidatus Nanoarchaeia archaeon]
MVDPVEYSSLLSFFRGMVSSRNNLYLEGAESFNCFENIFDQIGILEVYMRRMSNGELSSNIGDMVGGVDECALAYREQKIRFETLLTKKGFEVVGEVEWDYPGKIAMITHHGTVLIMGKNQNNGRKLSMWRIHSYYIDYSRREGFVVNNLKLGESSKIFVNPYERYSSSILRGLATTMRTVDSDDLEAKASKFMDIKIPDYIPETIKA